MPGYLFPLPVQAVVVVQVSGSCYFSSLHQELKMVYKGF